MDNTLLFIIISSTILFLAIVTWKLRWFYKKMILAEQQEPNKDEN